GWLASLFPAEAYAATAVDTPGAGILAGGKEVQIVTTGFGNGDAVCYALSTDMDGQVLAVGTAMDRAASSIVAARFIADDVIDRVTDRPGHRSSHISTLPSTEVTQTALTTGGEISGSFPQKIVRRGVLFGLKPGQVYRQPQSGAAGPTFDSWMNRLSGLVIPSALAAESTVPISAKTADTEPVLEEGITDNGSGTGIFYARLDRLLPSSVYYIRAYAMTSSGEMYYGDQISVRTADACFIATASFGTLLHPCVRILREFRDTYLLPSPWGQQLVRVYYALSPPIAAMIAHNAGLRFLVRTLLLPAIGFSWMALHFGLPGALLVLGVMASVIGHGVRRARRACNP
ncbi:MAG: CFI-box-CTERM domain-containing protein, partial [Desulfobulbus sp.]